MDAKTLTLFEKTLNAITKPEVIAILAVTAISAMVVLGGIAVAVILSKRDYRIEGKGKRRQFSIKSDTK